MVGKFSYDWPKLVNLRRNIKIQYGIGRGNKIGLLRHMHVILDVH